MKRLGLIPLFVLGVMLMLAALATFGVFLGES